MGPDRHGLGEARFVADADISAHLQTIVPQCDVIVGTEEEIHIAGGTTTRSPPAAGCASWRPRR